MFLKKETNNAGLLAAIDGGSLDNVLKGGNLIGDPGNVSEFDKEAIRRFNEKAAQIMEYAKGRPVRMVLEEFGGILTEYIFKY